MISKLLKLPMVLLVIVLYSVCMVGIVIVTAIKRFTKDDC